MSISTRVIFKPGGVLLQSLQLLQGVGTEISTQSFQQGNEVDPLWRMS